MVVRTSKEYLKKQNGITLIALIITILVMLILVAVTLTIALGDNGIISQTKEATKKYKEAEIIEKVEIAKISALDFFIADYFTKYMQLDEYEETKVDIEKNGCILDANLNMGYLYNELNSIFSDELVGDNPKLVMNLENDAMEIPIGNTTLKEAFKTTLGENFTYEDIYQYSEEAQIWYAYIKSEKWKEKSVEEIQLDLSELILSKYEERKFKITDEAIENLKQGKGNVEILTKMELSLAGIALHNYYISLEYNDKTYLIKANDTKVIGYDRDDYITLSKASELFDWVYEGDPDDCNISIIAYKGDSTNVVIPEKIGINTVVAIGGERDSDNYYRVLSGGGDEMTASMSIMEMYGEDLTESNWANVKALLEDTDFLGYVFPTDVNSYETFVQHTKTYQQNGIYYITVSMDTTTGVMTFKGQPPEVKMKLPSTITTIYQDAFVASNLKEINIPANVTEIPRYTFYSCYNLEKVTFDEGRTQALKIGYNAFENDTSLRDIDLPGISYIYKDAFKGCTSLKEITVKGFNGSGSLDYTVFANTGLEKITFDEGITSLGIGAVENNSNLKEVRIPASLISAEYLYNNFTGSHEDLKVYIKTPEGWDEEQKQAAIDKLFKDVTAEFIWE